MSVFEDALKAEGVTGKLADLARSVYMQESGGGGKNAKTSSAGAEGGMQIMPKTFASVADQGWDIKDPSQNARAGIRYLAQLDKMSGGNPALTAAGYYGGPGGMAKAKQGIAVGDPLNKAAPTTLQYGQQVVARVGKGAAPVPVQPSQAVAPVRAPVAEGVPLAPVVQAATAPVQATPIEPVPVEDQQWKAFNRALPSQPMQASALDFGGSVAPAMTLQSVMAQGAGQPKQERWNSNLAKAGPQWKWLG